MPDKDPDKANGPDDKATENQNASLSTPATNAPAGDEPTRSALSESVAAIDLGVAVDSGRQWMRMYSHAGVTFLPEVSSEGDMADFLDEVVYVDSTEVEIPGGSDSAQSQKEFSGAKVGAEVVPSVTDSSTGKSKAQMESTKSGSENSTGPQKSSIGTPLGSSAKPAAMRHSGPTVDDGQDIALLPDLADDQRVNQLTILKQEVQNCQKCPDLVSFRTHTVFGSGNPRPRLVLMGEAPKPDEDRLGLPMVGQEGQLMDKIIAAMKLRREDVYILNTVKCRPPQNRNPSEDECLNCRPYWRQQLEILRPQCIVCLGAVASKILLQTSLPVGRLRGTFHNYRGISVAVTYHPAYLLRTESAKRQTWEDMKMVMKLLEIDA